MRGVAAGQLDRSAYLGGTRTLLAGIPLHYLIAFTIAATFALASLRLPFLHSHFLLCGIFYGLGVWAVMTLVVMPLSALHAAGPYPWQGLAKGIVVHMFFIGLPVAASVRALGR